MVLAFGAFEAGDGRVNVIWPLLAWFGMGVSFMWYWPVALALVSKAAPPKVNSTLMGSVFLALFAGSVIMGWVGSFYETMSNSAFWTLDAAISFVSAIVIVILARPISRTLGLCND
jgi:POT family proton-dependent oligopeptide transporter